MIEHPPSEPVGCGHAAERTEGGDQARREFVGSQKMERQRSRPVEQRGLLNIEDVIEMGQDEAARA